MPMQTVNVLPSQPLLFQKKAIAADRGAMLLKLQKLRHCAQHAQAADGGVHALGVVARAGQPAARADLAALQLIALHRDGEPAPPGVAGKAQAAAARRAAAVGGARAARARRSAPSSCGALVGRRPRGGRRG